MLLLIAIFSINFQQISHCSFTAKYNYVLSHQRISTSLHCLCVKVPCKCYCSFQFHSKFTFDKSNCLHFPMTPAALAFVPSQQLLFHKLSLFEGHLVIIWHFPNISVSKLRSLCRTCGHQLTLRNHFCFTNLVSSEDI